MPLLDPTDAGVHPIAVTFEVFMAAFMAGVDLHFLAATNSGTVAARTVADEISSAAGISQPDLTADVAAYLSPTSAWHVTSSPPVPPGPAT
ncbi:hypothetical protein [Mycobacterium sp. MS1601]|uniref:hypothetical protein n=1 Tax=Mycobacterium sp. MS1601 TaxID=1936029 RepID=UPI0012FC85DF|nr:hypothetical protein [Mycobacterium sp. MS1601]